MIQKGLFPWKRHGLAKAKTGDEVSVDAGIFNSIESVSIKEAITEAEKRFPIFFVGKPIVSYNATVVNDPGRGRVWAVEDSVGEVPMSEINAFMQEVGADNMADGYWSVDRTGKILSPVGANAEDYAPGALFTCGIETHMVRSNRVLLGIKGARTLKASGRVVRPAVYRKSEFGLGVPPPQATVFIVGIESAEFVNSVYYPDCILFTDFYADLWGGPTDFLSYVCPSGQNFIQVYVTPHASPGFQYVERGDRLEEEYHKFNYYQEHYIWFVSSDINGYTVSLPDNPGANRGGYLHLLRTSRSGEVKDDSFAEQIISGHGDVRPSYDSIVFGETDAYVSGVTIKEQVVVQKAYAESDTLPSQVVEKLVQPCDTTEKVEFAYNVMGFNRYDENSKVISYGPEGSSATYVTVNAGAETKTDGLAVRLATPSRIRYVVRFIGLMKVSVKCSWKNGGYKDRVYIALVSESPMDWNVPVWLSEDNSTDAAFFLSGNSTTTVSHELDLSEVGAQRSPNGSVSFDLYIGVWMVIGKFDIVISQKRVSA